MAEIRPFRALRFQEKQAGAISTLTCPPYDIISEEERKAYLSANAHNIIRLELPREGEDPYQVAGETLRAWEQQGVLRQDDVPAFYLYEEEFTANGERKRLKGIICRVKLEEFEKGVVLPHEETLSKAKEDRFRLMQATFCNFSQIYSLYRDPQRKTRSLVDELSNREPDEEMTDGQGITHRLWIVPDGEKVQEICRQFAQRKLYIADGHHRYETALRFRNWCRETGRTKAGAAVDDVMMLLVEMENEGLVVFPTHRLVRDLNGFEPEKLLEGCARWFDVERQPAMENMKELLEQKYQAGKKAFGFYSGGSGWTLLTLRDAAPLQERLPDCSDALRQLDVTVLHTLVLEELMGIDKENMANQVNLTYTRSMEEAVQGVQKGDYQCAFLLNPTRVTEIRDVAAAGEKMPQKSTYFYPKLITGLVMNQFEDCK